MLFVRGLVTKYTYVDKTDMLWRLVSDSTDRLFFILRPRRFGKSLMLDTLKCIFEGRRELFKGLKIEKKRYDWKKCPVVMLNMAEVTASSVDELRTGLIDTVDGLVRSFCLQGVPRQPNPGKYGTLTLGGGEMRVSGPAYVGVGALEPLQESCRRLSVFGMDCKPLNVESRNACMI